jgi:hypothetical protein
MAGSGIRNEANPRKRRRKTVPGSSMDLTSGLKRISSLSASSTLSPTIHLSASLPIYHADGVRGAATSRRRGSASLCRRTLSR